MPTSISFSIPLKSACVPWCLENIIDKKVQNQALNRLEKLIDWIAMRLYSPYSTLYGAKKERVHFFSDNQAALYDCTKKGIAGLRLNEPLVPGADRRADRRYDFITLFHKRVFFDADLARMTVFGRAAYTDYVLITDGKNPDQVEIQEQEIERTPGIAPRLNQWTVDLNANQDARLHLQGANLALIESFYKAQNVAPVEQRIEEARA